MEIIIEITVFFRWIQNEEKKWNSGKNRLLQFDSVLKPSLLHMSIRTSYALELAYLGAHVAIAHYVRGTAKQPPYFQLLIFI